MRDGENIRQVTALGVDWIGMIFWDKSPRNVKMIPTHAGIIPDRAPSEFPLANEASSPVRSQKKVMRVGVFVDEMAQNIITRAVNFKLNLIQLHGHESPTFIRNLRATLDPDLRPGIHIIKAISVSNREDIATYRQYEDCVDYFLFDTKCQSVGGSGQQYDWSLLDSYDGSKPFLLSGGIGPDDAERVKAFRHSRFIGIDLNSRFETEPGLKDIQKLKTFLSQLQH